MRYQDALSETGDAGARAHVMSRRLWMWRCVRISAVPHALAPGARYGWDCFGRQTHSCGPSKADSLTIDPVCGGLMSGRI